MHELFKPGNILHGNLKCLDFSKKWINPGYIWRIYPGFINGWVKLKIFNHGIELSEQKIVVSLLQNVIKCSLKLYNFFIFSSFSKSNF